MEKPEKYFHPDDPLLCSYTYHYVEVIQLRMPIVIMWDDHWWLEYDWQ